MIWNLKLLIAGAVASALCGVCLIASGVLEPGPDLGGYDAPESATADAETTPETAPASRRVVHDEPRAEQPSSSVLPVAHAAEPPIVKPVDPAAVERKVDHAIATIQSDLHGLERSLTASVAKIERAHSSSDSDEELARAIERLEQRLDDTRQAVDRLAAAQAQTPAADRLEEKIDRVNAGMSTLESTAGSFRAIGQLAYDFLDRKTTQRVAHDGQFAKLSERVSWEEAELARRQRATARQREAIEHPPAGYDPAKLRAGLFTMQRRVETQRQLVERLRGELASWQ